MDQNTLTQILNMKNIPKNLKNYKKLNPKTISNTGSNHNNKTQILHQNLNPKNSKKIPAKPTKKPKSYNKTQIQKNHSKPITTSEAITTPHCKSIHIKSDFGWFDWFKARFKSFRTKIFLDLFQVGLSSNPDLMIFNLDLVRVSDRSTDKPPPKTRWKPRWEPPPHIPKKRTQAILLDANQRKIVSQWFSGT